MIEKKTSWPEWEKRGLRRWSSLKRESWEREGKGIDGREKEGKDGHERENESERDPKRTAPISKCDTLRLRHVAEIKVFTAWK